MQVPPARHGKRVRARLLMPVLLLLILAGCGGGNEGATVQWIEGTAPPNLLAQVSGTTPTAPVVIANPPTVAVNQSSGDEPTATTAPAPPTATIAAAQPTAAPTQPAVTGTKLTAAQLQEFQPNELANIPVLEYHVFTTDPDQEAQFARTTDDFKADLQWLYDHDFYVIPLKDLVANSIKAPAGKHPVVLTFDDSTTGQFRYLIADDGTVTIDPDSAVGIMEAFYAAHPDFGRGGFFAVLPNPAFCFSWQLEETDADQQPYCGQKLKFLMDNGYEVGNHTLDHKDLTDVDDDTFLKQVGGAIDALQQYDPRIEANIMAMPFGQYPDLDKHPQQREWLRKGFTWNGKDYRIIGALMVGANPTESPVSTAYDPLFISRIQAWDADARAGNDSLKDAMGMDDWFSLFADDPSQLYTSDGNPDTITVPNEDDLPVAFQGLLNTDLIDQQGKELIRY